MEEYLFVDWENYLKFVISFIWNKLKIDYLVNIWYFCKHYFVYTAISLLEIDNFFF